MTATTELRVQSVEPAIQPPRWLWAGYLAEGSVTLLHGAPRSGKTTLTSALLADLQRGGELAGQPIRPGRALVVSEDSLEQRRDSVPGFRLDKQLCWMCRPARGRSEDGAGLLQHIGDLVRVFAIDLVVIDPLAAFLPAQAEPFNSLTAAGVAMLLVHDEQAAPGTPPSYATLADIVLELGSGRSARARRLVASARFAGSPPPVEIELNQAGTAYALNLPERRPPARVAPAPRRRRGAG